MMVELQRGESCSRSMVDILVMLVGEMILMLKLKHEDWMMRLVLLVLVNHGAIAVPIHSVASFGAVPQIVPLSLSPIVHRTPRFAIRFHSGPPCRTRGRCEGFRALPLP